MPGQVSAHWMAGLRGQVNKVAAVMDTTCIGSSWCSLIASHGLKVPDAFARDQFGKMMVKVHRECGASVPK